MDWMVPMIIGPRNETARMMATTRAQTGTAPWERFGAV